MGNVTKKNEERYRELRYRKRRKWRKLRNLEELH